MSWKHALAKPEVRARQRVAASEYSIERWLNSDKFAYHQAIVLAAVEDDAFSSLDEKSQSVLDMRYLFTSLEDYKTLEDVGTYFRVTRGRAFQIESSAITKLTEMLGAY